MVRKLAGLCCIAALLLTASACSRKPSETEDKNPVTTAKTTVTATEAPNGDSPAGDNTTEAGVTNGTTVTDGTVGVTTTYTGSIVVIPDEDVLVDDDPDIGETTKKGQTTTTVKTTTKKGQTTTTVKGQTTVTTQTSGKTATSVSATTTKKQTTTTKQGATTTTTRTPGWTPWV